MTPPRIRPPFTADERTQLLGWLDMQRAIVHWKSEGLSEADAHRSVLPDSPLMTMAGIVSHLRWTEQTWFEVLFLGRPADGPQFAEWRGDGPEDADMMVEDVPLAQLLEEYTRQCAVSDEIIASHPLDEVGKHPDFDSAAASLRWMLLHMVEETARHAGHMDAIRELLDGEKGYY
ncbi:DinB family protein [Streptomyces sp. NPDC001514]